MSFWTPKERDSLDQIVVTAIVNNIQSAARSPGLAKITGTDGRPLDWQVQQGSGLSGARQSFRGLGLCEFSIELTLHTEEHRAEYEAWRTIVKPAPLGQPQKIFRIEHPVLLDVGITQIVMLNDPLLDVDGSVGWSRVTYKCREWRKPLPTLASPKESNNIAEKEIDEDLAYARGGAEAARVAVQKSIKGQAP